jgi:uridine kinase
MTTRAKKTNSPSGSMPPGTRASKNGAWSPPRPRPAAAAPPVLLVAIAGGSGSGKTWLAAALRRRLHPRAGLISLDDFYRDLARLPVAKRARTNFDSPAAIDWALFEATLRAIARGGTPLLPRYDFALHSRVPDPRRWRRRDIVLVEGLWPWVKPWLHGLFALRIYRTVEAGVRYERRLQRDIKHRGRTPDAVARQWRTQVEPMHVRHVTRQEKSADLVLGAQLAPTQLAELVQRIRGLAKS